MSIPAVNSASPDFALMVASQASRTAAPGLLFEDVKEGGPADVTVKNSPIDGLGAFARRTFSTGETILVRDERPVTPEQPLDPAQGEREHHCDRLDGGRLVHLGYPSRHVNHSCTPNAFLRRQEGMTYLVALKPIRPNEEIVRHYGVNRSGAEAMACNCGSEGCIGTLPGDFFDLPMDTKIELSPLLSAWFIFEHREAYRRFQREAGLAEEGL